MYLGMVMSVSPCEVIMSMSSSSVMPRCAPSSVTLHLYQCDLMSRSSMPALEPPAARASSLWIMSPLRAALYTILHLRASNEHSRR